MDEAHFAWVYGLFSYLGQGFSLAVAFQEVNEDGVPLWNGDLRVPIVRTESEPPEQELPGWRENAWVKISAGAWQKASSIPTVTALGVGAPGTPVSGIMGSSEQAQIPGTNIGIALLPISTPLIALINAMAASDVLVVPTYRPFDPDEAAAQTDLLPGEPFSAGEVSFLAAWLAAHGVTGGQFGAWFGMTAQQVADWMQSHTRLEFAVEVYGRFEA